MSRVFIIAEAGVNHNGSLETARKLISVAAEAGADAVKFQTFRADSLASSSAKKAEYQLAATGGDDSQQDMLKKLEITKKQNLELLNYCKKKNIIFLTTPYDEESLEELDVINLATYKIASTDTTNLPFLKKVAQKQKPIILSTGMSYLSEIEMALQEIYPINKDVILLHCTANYPVKDDEVNLNIINTFKEKFNILVGYSDHTSGIGAAPFAVCMEAKLIEKHFTSDKTLPGPDHKASLSPEELTAFIKQIRKVEEYLGTYVKTPSLSELNTRKSLQKYIVASCEIKKGEVFTEYNLTAKRTGGIGISPIYYYKLIGKKSENNYKNNEVINE